ncbi:hypothetical protein AVL62_12630 [Serinicoccus chungangensis]|uniref:DUF5673 domain-containing protein n=1 Tax=Serinicoccus chungangensis TaxID=767452 RepID=A0A0W8I109_9MICO|nr:hypothetical protein [Serinicoccus chungangensis]KUG51091.1 hypothetical protein AVL62_12630 [Serinicoccus chungangensis]
MPRVQIPPTRTRYWLMVGLWSLMLATTALRLVDGVRDGAAWLVVDLVLSLGTAALLVLTLTGALTVTADADGLHGHWFYGRRLVPWGEVTEIRPAPSYPERLVIRGETRRTLVEGMKPADDEVALLHTWHERAISGP